MAKKTKKTEPAVQAENGQSDASGTLLTQESKDTSAAPQNASGAELQKPEPENPPEDQEPDQKPETVPPTESEPEAIPKNSEPVVSPKAEESEPDHEVETLEAEPEPEAVLQTGQCPRCKHINSDRGFIFPGVNRVVAPGVYEGIKYQIVETRRTKCEKCGQIFFIKKYL